MKPRVSRKTPHIRSTLEVTMELLLFLLVVFLVFLVAGWGWRRGRSGI
jgi:hypothetical protein